MPSLLLRCSKRSNSPYINHFISADTVVASYTNPQTLNRYSYVSNNPLKYTDPTGHMLDKGDAAGSECHDQKCKDEVKIRKELGNFKKNLQSCLQNPPKCPQSTPIPLLTHTSADEPVITTPNPPWPHLQITIDWKNVDKLQASLDGAGIIGDVALVVAPEGPGEVGDAAITFVETVAAGKGAIDFIQGHPGNLVQQLATNGIEANLRLLARSTRWVPLAGSVASGYGLYDNFKGDIKISIVYK